MKVSYGVGDEFIREFEEMLCQAGKITKKSLIENALTMLRWAFRKVAEGNAVGALDERTNTFVELDMPVLASARRYKSCATVSAPSPSQEVSTSA